MPTPPPPESNVPGTPSPPPSPYTVTLEDMFTLGANGNNRITNNANRAAGIQFDAELLAFHVMQEADAKRLANYVFAASAAFDANHKSATATQARLRFPIKLLAAADPNSPMEEVILVPDTNPGGLTAFDLSIAPSCFYALGWSLPVNISSDQRYQMATLEDESRIIDALNTAIDSGIIAAPTLTVENVARRLKALATSGATSLSRCPADAKVKVVFDDAHGWKNFPGPMIEAFWVQSSSFWTTDATAGDALKGHLRLVLSVVTMEFAPSSARSRIDRPTG